MQYMKNVLLIIPFLPYPLESGGHQALFNGIKAIKDDYNVFITYEVSDCAEYRKSESSFLSILPRVSLMPLVHPEYIPPKRSLWWKIKNSFWTLTIGRKVPEKQVNPGLEDIWLSSIKPLSADFANHLDDIFKHHTFDIVQVEMPWMVSTVLNLPENVKKVFVHHEIGFVRRKLEMEGKEDVPVLRSTYKFLELLEINLLNKYDLIITLSEIDKQKLLEAGVVVPIEVSFATVESGKSVVRASYSKTLSFVGAGYHTPNLHGIKWFLENCWADILKKDENYRLIIIGKWEADIVSEITSKFANVEFSGFVDNLGTILQGTVMIVPILIGSGIRMKILEAASRGIPIVSTTVGAEGLPLKDGRECYIRDTSQGFVEAIFKMEDKQLRENMVVNAQSTIINKYSIDALKANRAQILESIICNKD